MWGVGMPRIDYRAAREDDLPALTDVMTRAFDDDARRHLGVEKGGPPGYDNGDFFRTWLFADLPTEGYVILRDGVLVGGIIVWVLEDDQLRLGCLFVDPSAQRLGIGTDAWRFLREAYPHARSWVLDTPTWSLSNHRFYEGCNFRQVGEDDDSVIYRQDFGR